MPIDTLKASKRLKALGFTEEQAEGIAELLNDTDAASATKDDLYALESRLDERFERIDERFGFVDERFDRIDERFDHIDNHIDKRFGRVDERFEQIDSRFEQIDDRFDALQADINERFELQSTRIDERFNAQHAEFKNYVTSRVAWAAGLLALYITLANYLMG
ncbi:hypothetical protein CRI93_08100 [Longimonas halophila]|uniref:t-SNARE coiled-coil homology domain-containing protein n=1 Tax=Longimonas halophila TaxID=1469170 RepID=A0A2H3NPP3_9BACT|nr:hypothetical protein [Longimonas halophila]PEN07089.1 hypothetical protein CRI93_08100 [Longimonas halophila]